MLSIVRIMDSTTCPVSTEAREIPIVRNRAMIPSVMSLFTICAVVEAP